MGIEEIAALMCLMINEFLEDNANGLGDGDLKRLEGLDRRIYGDRIGGRFDSGRVFFVSRSKSGWCLGGF